MSTYFLGKSLEKTEKALRMASINLLPVIKYTADTLCRPFYSSGSLVVQTTGDIKT